MSRPLVLYHANCADGFCAAWCAYLKFLDGADYLPVNYGQNPPDVAGRDVYILDFSYKRRVLEEMVNVCRSMVLRDHHKTAQADLEPVEGWPTCTDFLFDMSKSGGRLAWECFFPGEPAPWLVEYTEDRDLWRWKLPHSKEASAAIASLPHDYAVWDRLAAMVLPGGPSPPARLIDEGAAILRYQAQQVDEQCKNAVEIDMDGHRVLTVNATMLISEIAGKLAEGRPFGTSYFIRGDGKKVWSLRSRDGGVDVSEVAKRHGGGGHRNAAGFEEAS